MNSYIKEAIGNLNEEDRAARKQLSITGEFLTDILHAPSMGRMLESC